MAKKIKGKVVSNKMQKTVVVSVESKARHPMYEKVMKKTRRFKARDEIGVKMGDEVTIEECKPLSKEVCFKVIEVLGKEKK
ncbi:30S ribosomal protein S17 [Patescibacteria group bacterium]|nr:30S ribosomal protein S17 [Patescibacteria group bacterium]